jgi:hypothetical protein
MIHPDHLSDKNLGRSSFAQAYWINRCEEMELNSKTNLKSSCNPWVWNKTTSKDGQAGQREISQLFAEKLQSRPFRWEWSLYGLWAS